MWPRFLFAANLTGKQLKGWYDSETAARVRDTQAAGRVGGALFYGAGGGARVACVEALWGLGEVRRRGGVGGSGTRGAESAGAGEVLRLLAAGGGVVGAGRRGQDYAGAGEVHRL